MCQNAALGKIQDVLELGSRNTVNLVYGPNFQNIQALQDSTGCKLGIARGGTTLKLAGSSEAVANAGRRSLDCSVDFTTIFLIYISSFPSLKFL
jgi:hypothetical protein